MVLKLINLQNQEIGKERLEVKLSRLSRDPKIIASMEQMYTDINSGKRAEYQPRDYYHNIIIGKLFDKARKKAWTRVMDEQEAALIAQEREAKRIERNLKKQETSNILNIYK